MNNDTKIYTLAGILAVVILPLIFWGASRVRQDIDADLKPREAEIERKTFVNTPSYIEGKNQIIGKLIREYKLSKDITDKIALKEQIQSEALNVDTTKLNPQIRSFLNSL